MGSARPRASPTMTGSWDSRRRASGTWRCTKHPPARNVNLYRISAKIMVVHVIGGKHCALLFGIHTSRGAGGSFPASSRSRAVPPTFRSVSHSPHPSSLALSWNSFFPPLAAFSLPLRIYWGWREREAHTTTTHSEIAFGENEPITTTTTHIAGEGPLFPFLAAARGPRR